MDEGQLCKQDKQILLTFVVNSDREKKREPIGSLFLLDHRQIRFTVGKKERLDIIGKIEELVNQKFAEPEFEDCFLIEVKQRGPTKIAVFIDSDYGISFEQCRKVSRYLEQYLDEGQWIGESYVLEVSSPGVGRPLTLWRQYPRNVGRKLAVKMQDGKTVEGKLIEVNDLTLTLEEEVKGKKKKKEIIQRIVPFDHIEESIVKISF